MTDQTRRLSAEMRELLKADEDLPETTVDALHDLDTADAELSVMTQAVGLATTAVPSMEIDVHDPIGMMHRVVAETAQLRAELAQAQATIAAMRQALDGLWEIVSLPGDSAIGDMVVLALDDTAQHAADYTTRIQADERRKVLEEVKEIGRSSIDVRQFERRIEQLATQPEEEVKR